MVQGKQGTTNVRLSQVNGLAHLFSNKPRGPLHLNKPRGPLHLNKPRGPLHRP